MHTQNSTYILLRTTSIRIIAMSVSNRELKRPDSNMVKLRQRLDTLEALMTAAEGLDHLSADALSQYLLDHYTVDLDVLAQLADALEAHSVQSVRELNSAPISSVA